MPREITPTAFAVKEIGSAIEYADTNCHSKEMGGSLARLCCRKVADSAFTAKAIYVPRILAIASCYAVVSPKPLVNMPSKDPFWKYIYRKVHIDMKRLPLIYSYTMYPS
jgi:hypothetical protein